MHTGSSCKQDRPAHRFFLHTGSSCTEEDDTTPTNQFLRPLCFSRSKTYPMYHLIMYTDMSCVQFNHTVENFILFMVLILFADNTAQFWFYAQLLCTIAVLFCAHLLCTVTVQNFNSWYKFTLCTITMHSYSSSAWFKFFTQVHSVQLLCTVIVHSYYAQLLCTVIVHSYCAQLLFTVIVHSFNFMHRINLNTV